MIKSLKQYFSLRGLLARKLREKRKEIDKIRAKNRFFVSSYGAIDLSKVDRIGVSTFLGDRLLVFYYCYREVFRINFPSTCSDEDIEKLTLLAGEQLNQLNAYL